MDKMKIFQVVRSNRDEDDLRSLYLPIIVENYPTDIQERIANYSALITKYYGSKIEKECIIQFCEGLQKIHDKIVKNDSDVYQQLCEILYQSKLHEFDDWIVKT